MEKEFLGIDIGGSGIKGAIVDIKNGQLVTKKHRIATPHNSSPKNVAEIIQELISFFSWKGPVGIGFPGVVQNGVIKTAANLNKEWIGINAENLFSEKTGCRVFTTNDADAAAMAEFKFGRGKKGKDVIVMLTIGTGIGSCIFTEGKMLPNSELGHLNFREMIAEHYASDAIRKNNELSWDEWGNRLNEYLLEIERLFFPDRIILGGGVSKHFKKFSHCITTNAGVRPAKLLNDAGIIGAAAWANKKHKEFYKRYKNV